MNTIETNAPKTFDHYMRLALLVTVLIMYAGIITSFVFA